MTSTNIDTLLIHSYSLQQLRMGLRILKTYLTKKFFGKSDQTETVTEKETSWLMSLGEEFLNQFTNLNAQQKLQELESSINQLQPLTVYLAFEIPQEEIEKLCVFLRRENTPNLLLEIKFDPSLIGGCALSWKGVYKDYSLRSRVNEQRQQILSSFKHTSK